MSWLRTPGHARWLEAEGDRLLAFGRGSWHPDGGFGSLDDVGGIDVAAPRELYVTCRMTHVYALAHLMGRPGASAYVDHGIAALTGPFRDAEHGGWFKQLSDDGPVTDKTAYEHAFVVLAASSAVAVGRPGAQALLDEALAVFLEHFWDDEHGMVVEQWDRGWTTLDDYRGVNANMHSVEALLAAADVTGDAALRERASRIVGRVVHDVAPAHQWRIPEHFDATWSPLLDYHVDEPAHPFRPYGATIGHWLEWARLTLDLRAAGENAPDWMLTHAQALVDAAVREGWAVDGRDGFVYTVGWDGRPVVRERMHWVVAEAIAAAAALYDATADPAYASWYETWWDHVADCFRDEGGGSWWHELTPENRPGGQTWQGKPDVYHAFQATLLPRLPAAPTLAIALRDGLLG